MLSFFQILANPGVVHAQNAHFEDGRMTSARVLASCREFGEGIVHFWQAQQEEDAGPSCPVIDRKPEEATSSTGSPS